MCTVSSNSRGRTVPWVCVLAHCIRIEEGFLSKRGGPRPDPLHPGTHTRAGWRSGSLRRIVGSRDQGPTTSEWGS